MEYTRKITNLMQIYGELKVVAENFILNIPTGRALDYLNELKRKFAIYKSKIPISIQR